MNETLEYFLRLFCPQKLYAYSTKVRIPQNTIDFRKFLVAKFALKDPGSVIDGGAHIGYYSRYYSEMVGTSGKVFSFEPNPYIFRLLNKYAKSHGNIDACQQALSNISAKTSFYVEPFSLAQDSTLGKARKGMKKINVETVSIDDLISPTEKIRLIKLDVEGHEMKVLEGAEQTIHRCHPWIIFEYVQNDQRNDREELRLLDNWKYQCFDLMTLQQVPETAVIDLTDMVAIPQEECDERFMDLLKLIQ